MPRMARVKSIDSVYHIICRSISEVPLFKDSCDKDKYLKLIKKYQGTYLFKVYAYCLMDSHVHMIIDGAGADISKIMHGINQSYAQYFNIKHGRRGHLFQDRFKSKIVADDGYLIHLSSYIHNNPKDIQKYQGNVDKYQYSSYGMYLGKAKDSLSVLDCNFILSLFSKDAILAKREYKEYVMRNSEKELTDDIELVNERTEYRSERRVIIREYTPDEVVDFVCKYTKQDKSVINIKYSKKNSIVKALSALLMNGLCNMKQKDICAYMGNITQSHASRLCQRGYSLISETEQYRGIITCFIERKSC